MLDRSPLPIDLHGARVMEEPALDFRSISRSSSTVSFEPRIMCTMNGSKRFAKTRANRERNGGGDKSRGVLRRGGPTGTFWARYLCRRVTQPELDAVVRAARTLPFVHNEPFEVSPERLHADILDAIFPKRECGNQPTRGCVCVVKYISPRGRGDYDENDDAP